MISRRETTSYPRKKAIPMPRSTKYRVGKVQWMWGQPAHHDASGNLMHCRRCKMVRNLQQDELKGCTGYENRYVTVQGPNGREYVMVPGQDGTPVVRIAQYTVGRFNYHQPCENAASTRYRKRNSNKDLRQRLDRVEAELEAVRKGRAPTPAPTPPPAEPQPVARPPSLGASPSLGAYSDFGPEQGPMSGKHGKWARATPPPPDPDFLPPPITPGHTVSILDKLNAALDESPVFQHDEHRTSDQA